MTLLPGIAVLVAAMLSPARIQAKLNAIQATLSSRSDPAPKYVVYDSHTIIAGFRWQDEEGPNGLIVAYRVTPDGALKRLSTYKYGDDPQELTLADATGDDRPEVLVTGTHGNRTSPLEIISWDGKHLEELGETSTSGTAFIDVDGDGVAEVFTRGCCRTNECGAVLSDPWVQHYHDDELLELPLPDLEDFADMTKSGTAPESSQRGIDIRDTSPKTCTLHIINGTRDGRHRATSLALLAWPIGDEQNQHTIPVTLTAADATVDVAVTFPSRCMVLEMTVAGPPAAHVSILVRAHRP